MDNKEKLALFIDAFYDKVLKDERLAAIFLDVAKIDLPVHLAHIRQYWEKLLFGEREYQRHTMDIHRELNVKQQLEREDFQRWLGLFLSTLNARHEGDTADRAKRLAHNIANNMAVQMIPGFPKDEKIMPDKIPS
jgi:hemoglobin